MVYQFPPLKFLQTGNFVPFDKYFLAEDFSLGFLDSLVPANTAYSRVSTILLSVSWLLALKTWSLPLSFLVFKSWPKLRLFTLLRVLTKQPTQQSLILSLSFSSLSKLCQLVLRSEKVCPCHSTTSSLTWVWIVKESKDTVHYDWSVTLICPQGSCQWILRRPLWTLDGNQWENSPVFWVHLWNFYQLISSGKPSNTALSSHSVHLYVRLSQLWGEAVADSWPTWCGDFLWISTYLLYQRSKVFCLQNPEK